MTDLLTLSADDRDVMAGEYVLGTLDQVSSEAVEAAMTTDRTWNAAVTTWERHFAALIDFAPQEAPPPSLWDRVAAEIAQPAIVPRVRRAWLWPTWALGASLAAAALGLFAILPTAPQPQLTAVLVPQSTEPAFSVRVDGKGALQLAAATSAAGGRPIVAPGRSFQLWALPPGATAPTSLGVLPTNAAIYTVPAERVRAVPDMLILISQEPEGGSPTGLPTGPVVFYGRLISS